MQINFLNKFYYTPLGNGGLTVEEVIPVLRIFDYAKALEFYRDWLGFSVEWEHAFEENSPKYIEVAKGGITLHLSEHHGDGTPGTHVFVWCTGVKEYYEEIIAKNYKYNKPGLEKTFYGALAFIVNDPFNNRISFNEKIEENK